MRDIDGAGSSFFSVIVPVYNIKDYVGRCIDSIAHQTMRDIEVILVDDGSTDGSSLLCDFYVEQDPRIQVVHKENGGLSSARNTGIETAVGEYLLFPDGDDYYRDLSFFGALKEHIEDNQYPDLTVFGSTSYWVEREVFEDDPSALDERLNGSDVKTMLGALIAQDSLTVTAWSRALRRGLVKDGALFFRPGLLGEDFEWSLRVLDHISSMSVLDVRPYVYIKGRPQSITRNVGVRNLSDGLTVLEEYANDYTFSSDEMRRLLLGYCAYQYSVYCGLTARLSGDARRIFLERLDRLKWILELGTSSKVRRVRYLIGILGLSMTSRLLGLYIRLRRT